MPTGHILLVEDDRDVRESLQEALEDEGYTVVGAIDGVDALERLRAADPLPELVLLDLMMPRMSGAEVRGEMRKIPAWVGIPVIILSADSQVRTKAATLEVVSVLEKPIKLSTLFDEVARVLTARH